MRYEGHKNVTHFNGSEQQAWLTYTCVHCNKTVSGAVVAGYFVDGSVKWLLCPNCADGSVQSSDGTIYPGVGFGPAIEGLPDGVKEAYLEARRCMSVNALTACELMCRKILMHVAVEKGAKEGEAFAAYLTHLENQGYVTPPMRIWVALIREHGNRATHRLQAPDRTRAESTLMFTAELLRLVYEMEYMARKYVGQEKSATPRA